MKIDQSWPWLSSEEASRLAKEGKANVTSVTLWGMKDDESWLTGFRKERSYPMLFDDNYELKAADYAVVKGVEEV